MLSIRNGLIADAVRGLLEKKNPNLNIVEQRSTKLFCSSFAVNKPEIVIIEVKAMYPFSMNEWMPRINKLKSALPKCKISLIVDDENFPETANLVKQAKINGEIDAFFYASSSLNYLVDSIESL